MLFLTDQFIVDTFKFITLGKNNYVAYSLATSRDSAMLEGVTFLEAIISTGQGRVAHTDKENSHSPEGW